MLQEDLERIAVQLFQVPAAELAPHVREGVISMMMEDPVSHPWVNSSLEFRLHFETHVCED